MNAMEKMVAQMLGFTPEQMHETLNGIRGKIEAAEQKFDQILANQAAILSHLERNGNGGREQ